MLLQITNKPVYIFSLIFMEFVLFTFSALYAGEIHLIIQGTTSNGFLFLTCHFRNMPTYCSNIESTPILLALIGESL